MFWCEKCQGCVPDSAHHCRRCNKCVGHFDHHCPWLNNCVGAKNYWWFFSSIWSLLALEIVFVGSSTLLAFKVFFGTVGICMEGSILHTWDVHLSIALFVGIALCGLTILCLDSALITLHCWLCYYGLTTYDLIRPTAREEANSTVLQVARESFRPFQGGSKGFQPIAGCLNLYLGCLDLYLCVWTCILDTVYL